MTISKGQPEPEAEGSGIVPPPERMTKITVKEEAAWVAGAIAGPNCAHHERERPLLAVYRNRRSTETRRGQEAARSGLLRAGSCTLGRWRCGSPSGPDDPDIEECVRALERAMGEAYRRSWGNSSAGPAEVIVVGAIEETLGIAGCLPGGRQDASATRAWNARNPAPRSRRSHITGGVWADLRWNRRGLGGAPCMRSSATQSGGRAPERRNLQLWRPGCLSCGLTGRETARGCGGR
jgi:hypothetical protein